MKSRKSTKRALLLSVCSIMLCFVMLIGTTFAWFTDTASTAVNTIQSGTLDIDIVGADNESLDGKTLYFRNAKNETDILWKPGATFNLDQFRLVNKGNLALKYKLTINGVEGDTELLDAIDFTVKIGEANEKKLEDWDGILLPAGAEKKLDTEEVEKTSLITISGHMKETAGNEYQDKTLTGLGIKVVATQYTYEFDSEKNTYDKDAEYPISAEEIKNTYGNNGLNMPAGVNIVNNADGTFVITLNDEEAFVYFTQVFDRAAAFEARKAAWDAGEITKYPYEYNMSSLNMWYGSYCSKITLKMDCDVDLNNASVAPFGFGGYAVNFDGNGHTIKNAKIAATSGDVGFFASRVNVKNVTLDNIHVSATGCDSAGVVAGSPNSVLTGITVKNSSVTGAKYTGAIAGYDYGDITDCTVEKTVVSGQYKVGGIVGYICADNAETQRMITGNKLTDVTVKGENLWSGKAGFVVGKIVGNWNAPNGTCRNNTFTGTTDATADIGEIESGCNVAQ